MTDGNKNGTARKLEEFSRLRYGMFVHFGVFSRMARGEWVMNREQLTPEEIEVEAKQFHPDRFDAEEICRLAVDGGMKYIVFTTMHHEGFRMYESALTEFHSKNYTGRDFVAEIVAAARRNGLKIGLYHSLNNWHDQPDAVAALENPEDYRRFIENTFARLEELVRKFTPIDVLWYDGWWPFNAVTWQAERMNAAMRAIQPDLLFNGRNGLPGDFGTPENHLQAPSPWRPWEACMTLNNHWGFHRADHDWKSAADVVKMLLTCSTGRGNLLLNIGPNGSGAIPPASADVIRQTGEWIRNGGDELLEGLEPMPIHPGLREKGDRGNWDHQGTFSTRGNMLYMTMFYALPGKYVLTGLECRVTRVDNRVIGDLPFRQDGGRLTVEIPEKLAGMFAPVLRITCDHAPSIYRTGGLRTPECAHPRYDPLPPDIDYNC